ncbi:MAG: family 78 glycoside hydrolase catalytic domain [Clostridia bacterium]|nr:family 78 glycoside hydrolase catalytic domain [Clostridia bacterium]
MDNLIAKWILPEDSTELPVFRKSFELNSGVKEARAYISGLGLFELYINGRKAHDTFFEPGESVYEKTVYLCEFDIAEYLVKGINTVTVHLGNGFYHNAKNQSDRLNRTPEIIGGYMLICQLDITDIDGNLHTVISDDSWQCSKSKITESVWLGGEAYDDRIKYDFSIPVKETAFPFGRLKKKNFPSVKAIDSFSPVSSFKNENGNMVIDFGRNFAGTYIFKANAPCSTRVDFYFGETLNSDGSVNQKDFWGNIYDTYIFGEKSAEYTQEFVYHGFRYIEVKGIDADESNFTGIILHTDNRPVSEFECDNETVNHIHKVITRSIEDNMQSVFTDCPHREKLGWTEVYQLLFTTIAYNYDVRDYFRKLLSDLTDAQAENGSIPSIVPSFTKGIKEHALRDGNDLTPNDPSWCGALILAGLEYYRFYGDKGFLKTLYPYMKKYLAYLDTLSEDYLLPSGNLNRNLGDWMAIDPPSVTFAVSCVYYRLYRTMAEIADVINEPDFYSETAKKIKDAVNRSFYKNGYYDNNSQSANALALAYGLTDSSDVFENLVKSIVDNNYRLTVGEVALKPLFDVLCCNGRQDVAWELFLNAYAPLCENRTTLPESWEGKYSQNHAMLGAGDAFLFEHIAGIRNAGTAFDTISFNPYLPEDINELSLSYDSPGEKIRIHLTRDNGKIIKHIETEIPIVLKREAI